MGSNSTIEWTDATWNPLTGCSPVSEGCRNCYAAKETAGRLKNLPAYQGLAEFRGTGKDRRAVFNGRIRLLPERLDQPLRWKKPRRVFVNSMSDLFHESVPRSFIERVFSVMMGSARHTFQVLTKRPERMASLLSDEQFWTNAHLFGVEEYWDSYHMGMMPDWGATNPPSHIWLGTSVEDQDAADERIPHLLRTPAAVRFLSCEPLLGSVKLSQGHVDYLAGWGSEAVHVCGGDEERCWRSCPEQEQYQTEKIHWVIAGGESGPGARPMHPDWARSLRDQCQAAGVPFLFKQWGAWAPSEDPSHSVCPDGSTGAWDPWMEADYTFAPIAKVGKKSAGRELDGRTWDEMPEGAMT